MSKIFLSIQWPLAQLTVRHIHRKSQNFLSKSGGDQLICKVRGKKESNPIFSSFPIIFQEFQLLLSVIWGNLQVTCVNTHPVIDFILLELLVD